MLTKKRFKNFALTLIMFTGLVVSAQQTTGDVTKQGDIDPGTTTTAGAVRVIDNKGTIKYLQSQNGITMLSNTTDDVTTTTWQLGGALTNDTYIDVDGNIFGLNGIELIDAATELASTDATTESDAGTGTGYTILVRDESTGATKKLLATDLIQSGQEAFTAIADQTAYPLTGSPILPTFSQVWVYRNGAKLIANVDYTVTASTVTLVENDYSVYAGDIVEVQYIK
ncbi:hypothetical protein KO500_15015 [Cellulophaga baltica]|uniref:hypothetical protein n=1 Tax=Cellulophaga TaxID=104264 RepID=UPI001C07CCF4|nr:MULTISPECIES: hypothetical protein [Cellulophaga]MBU2997759.1 hypothetical protein [Cellulophaga baltica]MDO6769155.1 hypothetical protein [Cellulophaga sp. 1_MG-2023]